MIKYLIIFIIYSQLLFTIPLSAQSFETKKLTIIFAGDIMGHDPQISGAYNDSSQTYNYESTFLYIKDYISAADVAIANLEVTLAGSPYTGYPQFSSPDNLAFACREAGFDILANANNHALDRGGNGVRRTIDVLDSLGIGHLGTYKDLTTRDNSYPYIFIKNDIRIALLNYTFSTNGLSVQPPYIVNRIDTAQIRSDVIKAKSKSPHYIIVFLHWGNEYERDESLSQQKLAKYLLTQGVDAVIGAHPHVIQPIKFLSSGSDTLIKSPIVYSMGNFVSNQRAQYKDGGIMTELHLSLQNSKATLDSLKYLPYWVWRKDEVTGKSTFMVLPVSKYELDTVSYCLLPADVFRIKRFAHDTRTQLSNSKESDFYLKKKAPETEAFKIFR